MRLPLCATSTLEAVADERDRLRITNDKLTDQLVRLLRKRAGMREVASDLKPKPEPWPDDIIDHLQAYGNADVRNAEEIMIRGMLDNGRSWEQIRAEVL